MSEFESKTDFSAVEHHGIRPYCVDRVMNDPVDSDTVRLAMDGDDKAFSSLFMNTYRYVYTVARHYLNNDEDIYDAIQDTYTKVYANIGRLKDPEAFHSWLGKIAENAAKDIITLNGQPTSELNDETEEYLNETPIESSANDVNIDITAVFAQLSQEDAELLTYIYYDGFKVTEVARMQGLAATTVYSRLNAAKRRLKELLKIRGIEKPVYGGDIVALITTVIRNAIGTNLLSAAVADEILQSVTGKKTKAGVIISAVARKQRNAAVLRIASLIVLIAILTVGVFMGVFFAVRSALKVGSAGGSGSDTVGVSTEIGTTNDSRFDFTSTNDTSSDMQGVMGGNSEQGLPDTSSQSGSSGGVGGLGGTDQTVSEGNTSTDTSGDISDTNDPVGGGGNTNVTSSIPSQTVSSTPSKPSSSTATSSKPSASSTTSTTSSSTSSSTTSSSTPSSDVSNAVNYLGNTSNNLYNKVANGNIAKQGDWLYYTKETYSGSGVYGLYKIKVDGTGYALLHTSDFKMSQINVTGSRIYYNEAYRVYTISTNGTGCKKVSSFSQEVYSVHTIGDYVYASVATEPTITLYKSPITSGTHSWSVVSGYNKSALMLSDDGKYLYISEAGSTATTANYYRYNIASGEKTLVASDVNSKGCMMICGDYLAYPIYNTARTIKYNIVSVDNPSKIINTYYPSYAYCQFFSPYKGGTLGFDFNTSGTIYNMSGQSAAVTNISISGVASTFPDDDHIYYISGESIYMALPDGSKIVCLK